MKWPVVILLGTVSLIATACFGGEDDEDDASPTLPPATATAATPSPSPTASPTPDPLAKLPTSQIEARAWLQRALGPSRFDPPCPEVLKRAAISCAEGDTDGDGLSELAYLVPVKVPGSALPFPAAVFIRRGLSQKLDEFAFDLAADASILGVSVFAIAERSGDKFADLSYLKNTCGSTTCSTRAVVLAWDGTSWRDIGPSQPTSNIDMAKWEGTGAASKFTVHGGKLPSTASRDAGPSRASTVSYTLKNARYEPGETVRDTPEYLYHAIEDADALFETDRFAAIALYRKAITNRTLKDWKLRDDQPDRRSALIGYAYWRIALATAVLGDNPSAALDEVIVGSEEPLFDNVADVFRREFLEGQGVIGGCAAVNLYLTTPVEGFDTESYIEQRFNYGYANAPGGTWLDKICPF